MPPNSRPELTSIEEVMNFYDLHGEKICYVIYTGVMMRPDQVAFDYLDETQPDDAKEKLKQFLDLIKNREENTNIYTIQLVDSFKDKETKNGIVKTYTGKGLRFQLNQVQSTFNQPNGGTIVVQSKNNPLPANNNEMAAFLREMLEEQKEENRLLREQIEQRFEQLEDEEEDEEEDELLPPPPPTPKERLMGVLGSLAERDEVQEAIAGILVNGQKWLSKKVFKIGENE